MTLEQLAAKLEEFRLSMPQIAAEEAIAQVVEFAASGRNPDGSPWKPYTKKYLAWRASKGLPTSPVTKRVTGAFLDSVAHNSSNIKNRSMIIGPSDDQMQKARGLEKKRTSFGVSPLTETNLTRALEKKWKELLT